MSSSRVLPFSVALTLVAGVTTAARSQTVVYSNQANIGNSGIGAFAGSVEWDDLQITQGGTLSELSLIVRSPSTAPTLISGQFDLRVFDESLNRPQGTPLGVFPFDGIFPFDPTDPFGSRVEIGFDGLESQGITLPDTGRLGIGVQFDTGGWTLLPSGPAEIGSSPGGNWLGNSPTERFEFGNGLAWRVAVTDSAPTGPGVGSYNVFQTALATPDDPVTNGGTIANEDFFTGVGFSVERTTRVSEVGAFLRSFSGAEVFAAIIETPTVFSTLSLSDFDESSVVASTLVTLPGSFDGADVTADLDATLAPGSYFLMFGSGRFGATGDVSIRDSHIPNGDWPTRTVRVSDGLNITQLGTHRFFVNADSAPGTVQVRPTHDVLAEVVVDSFDEVESVRLVDGDGDLTVNNPGIDDQPAQYAVFDFSLENVPLDRDVLAVSLELDVWFTNSGTEFDVFGYAGDGAADRQDAFGQQEVIGIASVDSTGITTINLDAAFVQGLVDSGDSLGLTIVPDQTGAFGFETLETGQLGEPPLLTIALSAPPLTGDFNGDGVVDAADYTVWRDGAAPVDGPDGYALWSSTYGETVPAAAASTPEPTTVAMLLATVGLSIRARR